MCCFKGFLNVLKSTEVSQHYTQGKNKQLLLNLSLLPQISVPGHQSGDRAVGWCGIKESITLFVLMDTIKDASCVPNPLLFLRPSLREKHFNISLLRKSEGAGCVQSGEVMTEGGP